MSKSIVSPEIEKWLVLGVNILNTLQQKPEKKLIFSESLLHNQGDGLRFRAKKTAAMPSTTRSQKCCSVEGSTTAGSI
ncbi:Vacuolar protein sorting-associated protein 45-like protein [Senna tora]|uniref:Vacuolar protein sorting-associated protein 45-like protein n=1 Tax=Senna tora TaxID=362788 RepID=A0A834TW86_9FABA|nr:Vacuolar protein sorting-associated protein 45-like protein [Senna tora]